MLKKCIALARLDDRPELLFGLRQVDEKDSGSGLPLSTTFPSPPPLRARYK
jgi:hypothetical protein